jgi:hypothetical protein
MQDVLLFPEQAFNSGRPLGAPRDRSTKRVVAGQSLLSGA